MNHDWWSWWKKKYFLGGNDAQMGPSNLLGPLNPINPRLAVAVAWR